MIKSLLKKLVKTKSYKVNKPNKIWLSVESMDERIVPAIFTYNGVTNPTPAQFFTQTNWTDSEGLGRSPGHGFGGASHEIRVRNNLSFTWPTPAQAATEGITTDYTHPQSLFIYPGSTVTIPSGVTIVMGSTVGNSGNATVNGNLTINSGGIVTINGDLRVNGEDGLSGGKVEVTGQLSVPSSRLGASIDNSGGRFLLHSGANVQFYKIANRDSASFRLESGSQINGSSSAYSINDFINSRNSRVYVAGDMNSVAYNNQVTAETYMIGGNIGQGTFDLLSNVSNTGLFTGWGSIPSFHNGGSLFVGYSNPHDELTTSNNVLNISGNYTRFTSTSTATIQVRLYDDIVSSINFVTSTTKSMQATGTNFIWMQSGNHTQVSYDVIKHVSFNYASATTKFDNSDATNQVALAGAGLWLGQRIGNNYQANRLPPIPAAPNPAAGMAFGNNKTVISGTGFDGLKVTDVKFNGVSAPWFHVDSDIQITAITPAGSGAVSVAIVAGGSTIALSTGYTYNSSSLVLSPSANPSASGSSVTFTATGGIPSGVANFRVDGTLHATTFNGSGVATYSTSGLSADFHSITIQDVTGKKTVGIDQVVRSNPTITSSSSVNFTVGTYSSFTITTAGFPTPKISLTGNLPEGLAFVDNLDGTATISGTATQARYTLGAYTVGVTATNGSTTNATQTLTVTTKDVPVFVTDVSATAVVGKDFLFIVNASTFPIPTMTKTGSLPTGLTWTDNGDGTATISGNPSSGTAGNYSLTLTANNGIGSAVTQSFTLTVKNPVAITSITPNGNITALTGGISGAQQASRVASLKVVFNQAVDLDSDAFALSLHTNGVVYGGTTYANGYGTLPTSLNVTTTDNITYIITFVGNTDNGADGYNSIRDGVYDLNINNLSVRTFGTAISVESSISPFTFYRLFGDGTGSSTPSGGTPGVNYVAVDDSSDSGGSQGINAASNPIYYHAWWDFDGDGDRDASDLAQFTARFNKPLYWNL